MTGDPSIAEAGPGVYARIEQRLDRIEDKLDTRMTTLDAKVDAVGSRQDRLEGELRGSLGMVKWLGPTGVGALVYGLLKASNVL
jgi:hypothetical protein